MFVIPTCVGLNNTNDWVIFFIMLVLICYLYVDSSLLCINPMLKIDLGFNVYKVKIDNEFFYMLTKRKRLAHRKVMNIKLLGEWLVFEEVQNG